MPVILGEKSAFIVFNHSHFILNDLGNFILNFVDYFPADNCHFY